MAVQESGGMGVPGKGLREDAAAVGWEVEID